MSYVNVIDQNSRRRFLWDIFIVILIIFSCVIISYQVAFDQNRNDINDIVIYLIDLFFILDIYFNFFTSYNHQGIEFTDPQKIKRHYLRTFFPIDVIANFPFELIVLFIGELSAMNVSIVLILRLFRLLRVVRLFKIFHQWSEKSWTNSGILRIQKFLIIILLIIHWVACIWYLTAYVSKFPLNSWAVRAGIESADSFTQYLRSLYWAIVTMTTVGYGDITPFRNTEYILTIFVILLGASTYAFMIGNIASLISKIDSVKVNFWNRIDSANQYLRYKKVPEDLNERVRSYYEYIWAKHRGLDQNLFLEDLPESLRLETMQYIARDIIERVPIFKFSSQNLKNIFLISIKPKIYPPESLIVKQGELGNEIYFLSNGTAQIITADDKLHATLNDGDYFGDISLLLGERRTASVKALSYCELLLLTKEKFDQIKNDYPEFKDVLKKVSSERTEKTEKMIMDGIIL
jgi:hypothetical protein